MPVEWIVDLVLWHCGLLTSWPYTTGSCRHHLRRTRLLGQLKLVVDPYRPESLTGAVVPGAFALTLDLLTWAITGRVGTLAPPVSRRRRAFGSAAVFFILAGTADGCSSDLGEPPTIVGSSSPR